MAVKRKPDLDGVEIARDATDGRQIAVRFGGNVRREV
jgi:hypothetical protein